MFIDNNIKKFRDVPLLTENGMKILSTSIEKPYTIIWDTKTRISLRNLNLYQ